MKYFTVPQLAEILGVSRTTVFRMVKAGKIPATKVGRNYIINDEEISELLEAETSRNKETTIQTAVKIIVSEYGDVLKKLGKE